MADGEEKSFPATPKRREEARKKGQVARSPEFGPAVILLAVVLALHAGLAGGSEHLVHDLHLAFAFNPRQAMFGFESVQRWQLLGLTWGAQLILPLLLLVVVVGLAVGIGQVGFAVTPEALTPQWTRVNPATGLKRLLSLHGTVELIKGVLKMGVIGGLCYSTVRHALEDGDLLRTMRMPLPTMLSTVGHLLWILGVRVAVVLLMIAVADYAYQKYDYEKNLRMSASEIKQEMKQSEGDPQIKAKVRRLQREMAKRRMMQDVPKADVVVTNPTHYAVALQYASGAGAPKVVAKGQDEVARRIREIARENNVPLVENKPLAQALHKTVEIGREIPADMYEAVAQVLAFVYRTYGRRHRA